MLAAASEALPSLLGTLRDAGLDRAQVLAFVEKILDGYIPFPRDIDIEAPVSWQRGFDHDDRFIPLRAGEAA